MVLLSDFGGFRGGIFVLQSYFLSARLFGNRHDEESQTYDPGNYTSRLMPEVCANKSGIPPRFQFKDKCKICAACSE
jgi:hypothetical protein